MPRSQWEVLLEEQLRTSEVVRLSGRAWQPEFAFHPTRKFRFDFAFPELQVLITSVTAIRVQPIAIEVEGGTRTNGRHNRHQGFVEDAEKYNEAARLGWAVYRFPSELVEDGRAIKYIEEVLRG